MAKAFREGYAINPLLFRINRSGEDVPPFLRNSFIKDVTSEYMSTQTIEVSIPDSLKQQNRFAYLSMFDNKNWVPIAWDKMDVIELAAEKPKPEFHFRYGNEYAYENSVTCPFFSYRSGANFSDSPLW